MRWLAVLALLAGCTTEQGDLILNGAYRDAGDPCDRLGRFFTNDPNDDSPDLVACTGEGGPPGKLFPLGPEDGRDVFYVVPR